MDEDENRKFAEMSHEDHVMNVVDCDLYLRVAELPVTRENVIEFLDEAEEGGDNHFDSHEESDIDPFTAEVLEYSQNHR